MRKNQPKSCSQFYNKHKVLEKLKSDAKHEQKFCRKNSNETLLEHYIETVKNEFTENIHEKLGIRVIQFKVAGLGLPVENEPTTMKFLNPINREKTLSLFYTKSEKEKEILNEMLDRFLFIIGITNTIGRIHVQSFADYRLCE